MKLLGISDKGMKRIARAIQGQETGDVVDIVTKLVNYEIDWLDDSGANNFSESVMELAGLEEVDYDFEEDIYNAQKAVISGGDTSSFDENTINIAKQVLESQIDMFSEMYGGSTDDLIQEIAQDLGFSGEIDEELYNTVYDKMNALYGSGEVVETGGNETNSAQDDYNKWVDFGDTVVSLIEAGLFDDIVQMAIKVKPNIIDIVLSGNLVGEDSMKEIDKIPDIQGKIDYLLGIFPPSWVLKPIISESIGADKAQELLKEHQGA